MVQRDDAQNVLASSGTLYSMTQALERHVGEVIHFGPDLTRTGKLLVQVGKVLNKLSYLLFRRRISPRHTALLSRHAARLFGPQIRSTPVDVLFAPFASVEVAHLVTSRPIVYHTDMTWNDAVDYYPIYSSLFSFARNEGERLEGRALRKAVATVFPSKWAAQSAASHYRIDARTISVIPYGANFQRKDVPPKEVALQHHLDGSVRLLWIGVDWKRKGGDIAYKTLMELRGRGVEASLTVCGCIPPKSCVDPAMTVIPFLSKNDPEQRRRLSELYLHAHFFLFPTQGDAAAVVLCEASAHGLPCLVPETGGIGSVIVQGVNGYLLPEGASATQYADKLVDLTSDRERYVALVRSSRADFEERLNWDAWGQAMKPIFQRAARSTTPSE